MSTCRTAEADHAVLASKPQREVETRGGHRIEREIRRYALLIGARFVVGAITAIAVLTGLACIFFVLVPVEDAYGFTLQVAPVTVGSLLMGASILATLIVAIQFGARRSVRKLSDSTDDDVQEIARGNFLGIAAWFCIVGSVGLGILTSFWHSGLPGVVDPVRIVAPLMGAGLLAAAAADAMVRTEHPFGNEVTRATTRRRWIHLRTLAAFEPSLPMTPHRRRSLRVVFLAALPLALWGISLLILHSPSMPQLLLRGASIFIGCAASMIVVYWGALLLMTRQIVNIIALSVTTVSVGLLVWAVAVPTNVGGEHALRVMMLHLLAIPLLTTTVPLTIFALNVGSRTKRRSFLLDQVIRSVETARDREHQRYVALGTGTTAPKKRWSNSAVLAPFFIPFLPAVLLLGSLARNQFNRAAGTRGRGLVTASTWISSCLTFCLVLAIIVFAILG